MGVELIQNYPNAFGDVFLYQQHGAITIIIRYVPHHSRGWYIASARDVIMVSEVVGRSRTEVVT